MPLVIKNPPANAGDLRDVGLIPGLGRFPGEGNGNPLHILAWRLPWTEEPGRLHTVHRVAKNWTRLKQLNKHVRRNRNSVLISS